MKLTTTTTTTTTVPALTMLFTASDQPVQATTIEIGSLSSVIRLSTATDLDLVTSPGSLTTSSISSSISIFESTQTSASSVSYQLQTNLNGFSNDGSSETNASSIQANTTSMPTGTSYWASEDVSPRSASADNVAGRTSQGGNDTATASRVGAGGPVRTPKGLPKGWVVGFGVVGLVILLWVNLKHCRSERKTPRPETPKEEQGWSERLSRVVSEWVWH